MLAPPRPAEKEAAPPRPAKLTKPAGHKGAKLTIDYTDYANTFGLIEWGNGGKAFHVVFCTACDFLVCRETI